MSKEKLTLAYFEKLVSKLKETAALKGYDGTPTMDRLSETLQKIQMKELTKEANATIAKRLNGEETSTKFQDLVGKKGPAVKYTDRILAQENSKAAIFEK